MPEQIALQIIIGSAIGVAAIVSPFVYKGIRYVIKKDICLTIFKNKLEHQEKETENGHDTHKDLYKELEDVKTEQAATTAKVDILLKHFNLKSD